MTSYAGVTLTSQDGTGFVAVRGGGVPITLGRPKATRLAAARVTARPHYFLTTPDHTNVTNSLTRLSGPDLMRNMVLAPRITKKGDF